MNWLLGKITANPMLILWVALGAFAFGAASGGCAAWTVQGWRIDAVQAKFDGFVATTKALGDAAEKEKAGKIAADKLNKERSDNENARTLYALRADIKRLRDSNASRNFVPASGSASLRPDRACFDRIQLEHALRGFAIEAQGISDEGSKAVIDLNTAKTWAGGRQ